MLFAAAICAAALRAHPATPPPKPPDHPVQRVCKRMSVPRLSPAKRRRLVRLAKIDRLEWRETQLIDFLREARTESVLLRDDRVVAAGSNFLIGPVAVTRDFIGGVIIRAQIRNVAAQTVAADRRSAFAWLVIAHFHAADGRQADASVAVNRLAPGSSREIELTCPVDLVPASITWSVVTL